MTTPVAPRGQYHSTLNTTNVLSRCTINPSKKRPDHTTDSRDIKESGPRPHQAVITRHVDPNEPRYKLPSFEEELPEPPPLKYNFAHDISDIVGECHRSKLHTTCLEHPREHVRPELTKCDDISYQVKAESHILPHAKDTNLDITDIAGKKKYCFARCKTDMLNGRYDWKGAEEMPSEGLSETREYRREVLENRDYRKYDQMRTDDIAGLKEEKERKLKFKYGYNREIRNITHAEDCTCSKKYQVNTELGRSEKFTEQATDTSADLVGEEYKRKDEKQFYYRPPTIEQTYGNPDFFKAEIADKEAPSEATGYLLRNHETERKPGELDPLPYKAPSPELVCRKKYSKTTDPRLIPSAGMNLRGHEYACKNECVGELPGPSTEFYRIRSHFGRREANGIGTWIKRCDPDREVSGFETTWNEREVSKLGNYWEELERSSIRADTCLEKSATESLPKTNKFADIAPRTFCGESVTMRTISASEMRKGSVIPASRSALDENLKEYPSATAPNALKTKNIEVQAVEDLPW